MEQGARERQAKRAQLEQETALQEREDRFRRLRALRLAKEGLDRARAESGGGGEENFVS